jgi:threonine/homoserine/homoserine lactone efflux protein
VCGLMPNLQPSMFWVEPVFRGIGQGLVISLLSFGPSFFTLVKSGMKGGRSEGMKVALGIFLSEFTMAMVCFFGLSSLFVLPEFQLGFTLVAAIAVIAIGLRGYTKQYEQFIESLDKPVRGGNSFLKGFILSLLNPFVLFVWAGILAAVSMNYEQGEQHYRLSIFINLLAILVTLFSLDLGKVFLSDFIGRKMSNTVYFYVQKYFGLIFIVIGLYFMYRFVLLFFQYFHIAGF